MEGLTNQPESKAINAVEDSLREIVENPYNKIIVQDNLLKIFKNSSFTSNNEMLIKQDCGLDIKKYDIKGII